MSISSKFNKLTILRLYSYFTVEEKASSACVSRILKQPPGKFICHAVEELGIIEGPLLIEALHVYVKEWHLILRGSFNHDNVDSANNSPVSKKKHCTISTKDESSTVSIN